MKDVESLETKRTIMRKLTPKDAEDFFAVNPDADGVKNGALIS